MTRQWVQSASIEVDPANGAWLVATAPPTSMVGGTRTAPTTAARKLVTAVTPCKFVWIGARVDAAGALQNTALVMIGDQGSQNMPILATNIDGFLIQIDDASKVYIKPTVAGEGVAYRIFA